MMGLTDLQQLEKQAFRKFYEDGLFDVFLGSTVGLMALGAFITDRYGSEAAGTIVMVGIAFGLATILITLRRRLLASRLGTFTPGPRRRRRIAGARLVLLASVVVGLVAFGIGAAFTGRDLPLASMELLFPLLWFVNATVVLGAMGYLLDVPRFYLHGPLFGLAMPLLVWPDVLWDVRVPAPLAFGLPAGFIVGIGLWKLARFLREYPAASRDGEEALHAGR